MVEKPTKLLEKFKKKVEETKKLQESEWDSLKIDCQHREGLKDPKIDQNYVCKAKTLNNNNTEKYIYYCHFSNCRYT